MLQQYDYIITGAGCAGLSLLKRMMDHSFFSNKKILLIDKNNKTANDRTWCFWEQQPGVFDNIVHHRWQQIDFHSNDFSSRFDLAPYEYKMIRGIDLYTTVLSEARQHSNIDILHEEVLNVSSNENNVSVKTLNNEFYSEYVFNSIIFNDWRRQALQQKNIYVLLQHFKGLLIEFNETVFDERIATFMDFRVSQDKGTSFLYVLPVAKNKVLLEYTVFSEEVLQEKNYDNALASYIEAVLGIKKYTVTHTESGIIPMTNYHFPGGKEKIINIGIAGRQTKASSGYAFQFIQKHSAKIIEALVQYKSPLLKEPVYERRFRLYDSILLNVLYHKKMSGDKLFTQLFKKNSPQNLLKFLDNETNFIEELKIMNSVSMKTFLPTAIKEIYNLSYGR